MPKPFWVVVIGRRHAIFIIFKAFPEPEKLLVIRNTENVCPSLDLRSCVLPWRLFTRLAMLAMLPSTTTPRAAAAGGAVGLQPLVDPRTLQRRPPTQPTNPTNLTGQRQKSPMHQTSIFSIYIGGVVASTLIWNLDLHFMRTPSPLQDPAARPYKRASKAPKPRQTSLGSLLFHKLPLLPSKLGFFSLLIHHQLFLVQTSISNPPI